MSLQTPRLEQAIVFTVEAFRGHTRKGSQIPYITHLFSVMSLVAEYGGDEDQCIAALLHDYLEDIEGAQREILHRHFGERVLGYVVALSDTEVHPKPPWKERKLNYLAHLEGESAEVKLIACADKLHNLLTLRRDYPQVGEGLWGRFRGGKAGTLWYYEAVGRALQHNWTHPMLDTLIDEFGRLKAEIA